ncbi:MAG: methyltransferase domain-containing protein [Acidobacteria bacterium]|nr:methyltransferase domain-containing protein [Acidobacteriota bacterium]
MKLFRGSSDSSAPGPVQTAQRVSRRSSGLAELAKSFASDETLCVLDLGYTSAANIRYLTERGHKIYSEDLLIASTDPDLATVNEEGKPALDSKRFLAENLTYPAAHFDVVLCWNLADYLDESLVKPVVGRLWSVLKPGGVLLAFFHTREAGPDAPCYRYHITGADTLEMQAIEPRRETRRGPTGAVHTAIESNFRLQRVFNNRHVENLFRDFASIKFFLSRDTIREVLVVR